MLPDGRVLIAGGTDDQYGVLPKAEVFDPDTGESIAVGEPADGLVGRSATSLDDGRVLLIGGMAEGDDENPVASAEVWNPALGTLSPSGSLAIPRFGHTAMLLPDGRVLVVGGQGTEGIVVTAEVWDPATGVFSSAGPVPGVQYGTAITMLPDGPVLLVGGATGDIGTGHEVDESRGEATRWNPSPAARPPQGRPPSGGSTRPPRCSATVGS